MSIDEFSLRYSDLVTGSYDCVDRIVLNAFFPLGYNPGGFRVWWRRWHDDSDAELDNTHLMRLAGRFARRVKAWGAANGVPVIFCTAGERKHRIAEAYLATHEVGIGVFLVLVAKAPAPVWKVARSAKTDTIVNIERRREYVNHYSFHIIDPEWGHVTIKMSGHPPFGAQIILNGHEFVARQAGAAGIAFTKAGNCFTAVADPAGLARIADALSQDAAVGRLGQVCQRWIYTACLCFGLDRDEQHRSGFGYGFAVYQLEYSRNLIFADGTTMQRVFDTVVDRTRSRLDVPKVRTIFGSAQRPRRTRKRSSLIEAAIETPSYDLTVFKLHFGRLTGKAYTKDEMCWGTPSVQTLVAMASVMFQELEEVPMTMVGGLDVHRQQITFDYVDDDGLVHWGQIRPATRKTLRGWLAEHFRDGDADFALEGCTGWRYVSEELAAAGLGVHLGDPAETAALRGRKKRAKTDRADARLLRTLLVEGRFPESWIPPAHVVEVRTLGRLYCTLMDERRAWQQRIHAQLFYQAGRHSGAAVAGRGRHARACRAVGGGSSVCGYRVAAHW